jgi:hypothetical protein
VEGRQQHLRHLYAVVRSQDVPVHVQLQRVLAAVAVGQVAQRLPAEDKGDSADAAAVE